ncbi:hypothetical protein [Micromonospora sp. WMMD975]|uniref:hypothetical protein n=1 Tax=Micromonospora sp. WMMD975 TaxID=3016087 RepID=UPI00249A19B9|nr:hypothetical protein [Micromonospora sp. WMMD975]WFE31086.1 hypothetical protein O7613_15710 [Micromonospora sp. WMMD975]
MAPPRTSRRRGLWVATGVAGLTGVVGLAALGGLAARNDRAGDPERVADNRATAPQNADEASPEDSVGHDPKAEDHADHDPKAESGTGHDLKGEDLFDAGPAWEGVHGQGGPDGKDADGREGPEWGARGGAEEHDGTREVPCDDDALVDAIELANRDHGGTLKLAEKCTYELDVKDRKIGGALPEIKQDVTIKGNGSTITRDAEDSFRIFRVVDGGALTLKDLTISGGNASEFAYPQGSVGLRRQAGPVARPPAAVRSAPAGGGEKRGEGDGGALLVERGGKARLAQVTLTGNNAGGDGGAVANFGRVWLEDSKVVNNHARGDGGGVFNRGVLKVEETKVDDNTAGGNGGGIANGGGGRRTGVGHVAGTVEITGAWDGKDTSPSTLSRNHAGRNGGGLFSGGGYVTVSFTAITGNTACENGGGIYAENTDLDVGKVIVAGNHAGRDGGGVDTGEGFATVADSIIVDNTANRFGGGIYNGQWLIKIEDGFLTTPQDEDDNAALTLRNTVIKGNTALNGGGIFNNKAKITLTKTHVTENTATDTAKLHRVAGGVLNHEGHVKLDDESLISNNDPTNCANTVEDCFT